LLHESYLSESGWCGLRRRVRYTKFRTRRSHVMGAGSLLLVGLAPLQRQPQSKAVIDEFE
jgi:hypothetical protein